jgi:FkbM family methyltransferase
VVLELTELPLLVRLLQKIEFPHKLGVMDRFFGRALAEHDVCWVQTGAGMPWKLDLRNSAHRWIVYGKYEGPGFHRWARQSVRRNGVIVDSGANIGQMLVYLAPLVPEGRVLAFEPGRTQADWIAECLLVNPGLPVELIRSGLGSREGTELLNDQGSPITYGAQSFISKTGTPVQVVRLEDELKRRAIEKVALWKLDVEGYEVPALEGATSLLRKKAIAAIYAELHEENGQRTKGFLSDFGYRCYAISDRGQISLMQVFPAHTNGLFLPQ